MLAYWQNNIAENFLPPISGKKKDGGINEENGKWAFESQKANLNYVDSIEISFKNK